MKAYLCARYDHREQMKGYARQLMDHGVSVPAHWIWKGNEDYSWPEIAVLDMQDLFEVLNEGGFIISFTETDKQYFSGGRHVEFGMALAAYVIYREMSDGIVPRLVRIGPAENVFHDYAHVEKYDTFEEFLENLSMTEGRTLEEVKLELGLV